MSSRICTPFVFGFAMLIVAKLRNANVISPDQSLLVACGLLASACHQRSYSGDNG